MTDKIHSELNALISLIDEPNEQMFGQIKKQLQGYGHQAIPLLENAWDNSFEPEIQDRIENIIHGIQQESLFEELEIWKKEGQYDLLQGFLIISKFQYPDLDEEALKSQVDAIKRDIWLELNSNLTALEKVKVINHILFDVHGFSGNKTNVEALHNVFLNNLLETKKGNYLSLGILYIFISQKLGIPVFGVDLPRHFVLAYVDEVHDEKYSVADESEILFYINPFNKGAVFTHREIETYIRHMKLSPKSSYFRPCHNRLIILRVVEFLMDSFKESGLTEKVEELAILVALLQE